jgi:hypothetical protein
MGDGPWETVGRGDRDSKGDPDSEHAAAAADSRGADSRVRESDEIIVGWRVWSLAFATASYPSNNTSAPVVLSSTFMVDQWQPGKIMAACCGTHFLRHGVHAFTTREQTVAYMREGLKPARYVFGEVSLWGRVVIHEDGYRAAYAYPKHIFVPSQYQGGRDLVNELRRAYGIEAEWTR